MELSEKRKLMRSALLEKKEILQGYSPNKLFLGSEISSKLLNEIKKLMGKSVPVENVIGYYGLDYEIEGFVFFSDGLLLRTKYEKTETLFLEYEEIIRTKHVVDETEKKGKVQKSEYNVLFYKTEEDGVIGFNNNYNFSFVDEVVSAFKEIEEKLKHSENEDKMRLDFLINDDGILEKDYLDILANFRTAIENL